MVNETLQPPNATLELRESNESNAKQDDDSDSSTPKRLEHLSDLTGSWGPFQKRLFALLVIIYLMAAIYNAGILFYAVKLPFKCHNPSEQISIFGTKVNILLRLT